MRKITYKGAEIRTYGEKEGEGVYPLAFTDDLDGSNNGRNIVHDCLSDAKAYINKCNK